jgi:hypothetical protein
MLKNKLKKYTEDYLNEEHCSFREGRDAAFALQQITRLMTRETYQSICYSLTVQKPVIV